MKVPFFDINRQHQPIKDEINSVINTIVQSGHFVNGPHSQKFEKEFADYVGTEYCLSCGNGTDAIELALEVLGVKKGDEIIVPNHTWISTASAVSRLGAVPVFSKSSEDDFNIDIEYVEQLISKNTKGIIGVHLYGNPCNVIELKKLSDEHGLFFIEDCAQAHGAEVDGQKIGSFGDAATFSFYPSKNLGCFGDGGCITTNNINLVEKLYALKNCGQSSKNQHAFPGRNSRLDEIQAAVLSVKLIHLNKWNNMKIDAANQYISHLQHPQIKFQKINKKHKAVYHIFSIRTKNRSNLSEHLAKMNIGTGLHYPKGLADISFYQPDENLRPKNQEYIYELISLPMFPHITSEEINYVCDNIISFIGQ